MTGKNKSKSDAVDKPSVATETENRNMTTTTTASAAPWQSKHHPQLNQWTSDNWLPVVPYKIPRSRSHNWCQCHSRYPHISTITNNSHNKDTLLRCPGIPAQVPQAPVDQRDPQGAQVRRWRQLCLWGMESLGQHRINIRVSRCSIKYIHTLRRNSLSLMLARIARMYEVPCPPHVSVLLPRWQSTAGKQSQLMSGQLKWRCVR